MNSILDLPDRTKIAAKTAAAKGWKIVFAHYDREKNFVSGLFEKCDGEILKMQNLSAMV